MGLGLSPCSVSLTARCSLSRSGSFWFEAEESARRIRAIVPTAERVPVLRIAIPLSPSAAAEKDPVLAELMAWASTVVKLPLTNPNSKWLSEDIGAFPAEFLLFCPHVSELRFEDRSNSLVRVVRLETDGSRYTLTEGGRPHPWRVFVTTHRPSDVEKKDAGELADRDELPVIWAVDLDGRPQRGKFWAFFPTEYFTTLSGILNAPWKTNEDRQNLLPGAFNNALLAVGAQLVADHLGDLVTADDPARHLDLMPARGREAPNWADEELTRLVYALAVERPSLPDQRGVLRKPASLKLHPAGLPTEALEMWAAASAAPSDWCHRAVDTRERRPRAERLLDGAGRQVAMGRVWIEALVSDPSVENSIAALQVAAAVVQGGTPDQIAEVRSARILLSDDNRLVQPVPGAVFIAGSYSSAAPLTYVNRDLVLDPVGRASLETLGIGAVDPMSEIDARLAQGTDDWDPGDWDFFWTLARAGGQDAVAVIKRRLAPDKIRVRTVSGRMRPLPSTLLPGPIVQASSERDATTTIDVAFHALELDLLRQLGASAAPTPDGGSATEAWFDDYRLEALRELATRSTGARPQLDHVEFDRSGFVGPLTPLRTLSPEAAVRFTEAALRAITDPTDWTARHRTRPDKYPEVLLPAPDLWMLRREGVVGTSQGPNSVSESVSPRLQRFSGALPVAECTETEGDLLGLRTELRDLDSLMWEKAFAAMERVDDDASLGAFYAAACRVVGSPTHLQCRIGRSHGTYPTAGVTVVTSRRELDALSAQDQPCLLTPLIEDVRDLVGRWGLTPAETLVRTEVYHIASGPEVALADEFPGLRLYLEADRMKFGFTRCAVLRLDTLTDKGSFPEERRFYIGDRVVYAFDDVEPRDVLERINREWRLDLTAADIETILDDRKNNEYIRRLARIRERPTHEERLVEAIGEARILRHLPTALLENVRAYAGEPDIAAVGRLALAVYGVDVLSEFSTELEENGMQPPARWAGSSSALTFVRDLGFPRAFAGYEARGLDPVLEVDGPPEPSKPSRLPAGYRGKCPRAGAQGCRRKGSSIPPDRRRQDPGCCRSPHRVPERGRTQFAGALDRAISRAVRTGRTNME